MERDEVADSLDRKDETRMATVTTPLRIGPADHGRTMTLEEFLDAEARKDTATSWRGECSK